MKVKKKKKDYTSDRVVMLTLPLYVTLLLVTTDTTIEYFIIGSVLLVTVQRKLKKKTDG